MTTRGREGAFTLLEVLVALAILSLAVVVSIQAFAAGLRMLKLSGEHQEAMLIADQRTREVLKPEPGKKDQGTDGAFTWERETKALPAPDLEIEGRTTKWRVYEIDVRVRWGERRELRLATLRTVPESPNSLPGNSPLPGRRP